jgi:hypothetical protein
MRIKLTRKWSEEDRHLAVSVDVKTWVKEKYWIGGDGPIECEYEVKIGKELIVYKKGSDTFFVNSDIYHRLKVIERLKKLEQI